MRYALPLEIPTHRELVENYCFWICEQISIACVNIDGAGICWVCEQDVCKYEAQTIQIAPDVTLRKLKDKKEKSAIANG